MLFFFVAHAAPTVGGFVGLHAAGPKHELYDPSTVNHSPLGVSASLGVRLGLELRDLVLLEGEAMGGPALQTDGRVFGLRAHAGLLAPQVGRFTAGGLVGGGVLAINSTVLGNDLDSATHFGALAKIALSETLSLRGDLRWLASGRLGPGGIGWHTEAMVGLSYRPAPKQSDTDGDGLPDDVDKCPEDGELKNGYRDEDGCPDDLATVRIKVKNAEGDLVRNAVVSMNGEPIGNSNRDGRLTLPDLQPESNITLTPAYEGLRSEPVELTLNEGDNKVDLILGWSPGTVVVTAKNLGGTPLQATVWAEGPGKEHWTLDRRGYSERVLPVGVWRIMLASEGYDAIIKLIELPDAIGPRQHIDAILRPQRIQIRNDQIVTLDPILFKKGSSLIDPASLGLIEAVAAVLVNHPEILEVEVGGHASAEGSTISNMQLSQERVDEVKKMLVARGVDASRLFATGYGETRPKFDNATAAGRRRNRRVEFHVLRTTSKE